LICIDLQSLEPVRSVNSLNTWKEKSKMAGKAG